ARDVTVRGRLELIQVDDFEGGGSRVVHRVHDEKTGRLFELDFPDLSPGLRTGMLVKVHGRLVPSARRDHARVLAAPADGSTSLSVLAEPMAAAAAVTGGRKANVPSGGLPPGRETLRRPDPRAPARQLP